jgi:hypothetical protein
MGSLTAHGSSGIRVFLVDDHPAMLDAVGRALVEAQGRPPTAPSGATRARGPHRNSRWCA